MKQKLIDLFIFTVLGFLFYKFLQFAAWFNHRS